MRESTDKQNRKQNEKARDLARTAQRSFKLSTVRCEGAPVIQTTQPFATYRASFSTFVPYPNDRD